MISVWPLWRCFVKCMYPVELQHTPGQDNFHHVQKALNLLLSRVCNNSGECEFLSLKVAKSLTALYGTSALLMIFQTWWGGGGSSHS